MPPGPTLNEETVLSPKLVTKAYSAGFTVKVTGAATKVDPASVAVMTVVPMATPVAMPVEAPMVAAAGVADVHVIPAVITCVEVSLYVPVSASWLVEPLMTMGAAGVTAMETSVAGVTVNIAVPEMLPEVAVMVVEPTVKAVAVPMVDPVVLMVATVVLDDAQVTVLVMTFVV
jgi:hypothetical protein